MSDIREGRSRPASSAFGESDPYSRLRVGIEGTVSIVDDLGTVHVDWGDGGRLGMIVAPPAGRNRIESSSSAPGPLDKT